MKNIGKYGIKISTIRYFQKQGKELNFYNGFHVIESIARRYVNQLETLSSRDIGHIVLQLSGVDALRLIAPVRKPVTAISVVAENLDTLDTFDATFVQNFTAAKFVSLDNAEQCLRAFAEAADWFVYRGGNHVALHRSAGPNIARVLFVAEVTR